MGVNTLLGQRVEAPEKTSAFEADGFGRRAMVGLTPLLPPLRQTRRTKGGKGALMLETNQLCVHQNKALPHGEWYHDIIIVVVRRVGG